MVEFFGEGVVVVGSVHCSLIGVMLSWEGAVMGCGCRWRRREKRLRLRRCSCVIFDFRWSPVLVSLVIVLVGLEMGLVVSGGCGWERRRLVKRPVRNMLGLSRHDIGFGSRGGGFCGCSSRGGSGGISEGRGGGCCV